MCYAAPWRLFWVAQPERGRGGDLGKGTLSDESWLSALQGRLINFEKRRKVSGRNITGKGQVLGGKGGQSPTQLETWLHRPPSCYIWEECWILNRWGSFSHRRVGQEVESRTASGRGVAV